MGTNTQYPQNATKVMDSETFDKKLNELREIKDRMKSYDHNTPISQVLADQKRAQDLHDQLIETINTFRA